MFCRNCGREVNQQAVACPACGMPPNLERRFCPNCGQPTDVRQVLCTKCGASLATVQAAGGKDKIAAGLLGIFLGSLGIHKFYLGMNNEGVTMLLITLIGGLVTCGVAAAIMSIIGLVEAIIYMTRSDQEFTTTYVTGRKGWF